MAENYEWNKDNTVFSSVRAVAVYLNPDNQIVIRQEASINDEEDSCVIVPAEQIDNLVLALQHAKREAAEQG